MNTTTSTTVVSSSLTLQKVDRVGVATSVLCAIHCAIAPILLIALPSFGRVWAHPASHILVALFVVPIAVFSIRKGYRSHRKRWILITASVGILFVLIGAMLPAFSKASETVATASLVADVSSSSDGSSGTSEATCGSACSESTESLATSDGASASTSGCVDNCCPSLQVDESGKTTLHVPPAAIVTTMGGFFLIAAHIGNLCSCGHACRTRKCAC